MELLCKRYTDVVVITNSGSYFFYPHHYHSAIEFQLICRGSWRYFIDNAVYQCQSRSLVIIHKNEVHNCIPTPNPHNKKMSLVIPLKMLADRPGTAEILESLKSIYHIKLTEKQAEMVELAIREISEECRLKQSRWQDAVICIIERLLILLDRAQLNSMDKLMENNPLIQDVLAYLEGHYTEKISLSQMADHFGLSQYWFSRTFRQYVGVGFQKYMIQRRIAEAKYMLEQTDLKILAVANAVGFDDLSAFNRDFKLVTGVSPSLYRKISL